MAEAFRKLSPSQVERLKQLSQPQLSALEQVLRQKIRDNELVSSSELAKFGLEPERHHRDTGPRFSAGYNNCLPPACGGL